MEAAMDIPTQFNATDTARTEENPVAMIPPVDIVEDETGFTLTADLPGVSRDRLGVKVNGENLLIEGEVATPVPQGLELL
jgi:HSP20 family molecular chaperone IbpA